MVAEPQIFDYIDDSQTVFENTPAKAFHSHVGVYKHHGFWQCMDTLREKVFRRTLGKNGLHGHRYPNPASHLFSLSPISVLIPLLVFVPSRYTACQYTLLQT